MSGLRSAWRPSPDHLPDGISETVLRERTLPLPVVTTVRPYLEVIRLAAADRLCVDLQVQWSARQIELYSLRRTLDGNILPQITRTSDAENHSYRIDRIQEAKATEQSFAPRYAVELSPQSQASSHQLQPGVLTIRTDHNHGLPLEYGVDSPVRVVRRVARNGMALRFAPLVSILTALRIYHPCRGLTKG